VRSTTKPAVPFDVSHRGRVNLRIYSIAGRLVRELESGVRDAGHHEAVWDGRDAEGGPLPSSIYLSQLQIDGRQVGARKLLLLR
jgi:flagellar hook assembly protein FlgD